MLITWAGSWTWSSRDTPRPRPGQRVSGLEVRTPDGSDRVFAVLCGGRQVMVVTAADPASAVAGPALQPYQGLFEVVTRGSGDAQATRAGSVVLIRPDDTLPSAAGRASPARRLLRCSDAGHTADPDRGCRDRRAHAGSQPRAVRDHSGCRRDRRSLVVARPRADADQQRRPGAAPRRTGPGRHRPWGGAGADHPY